MICNSLLWYIFIRITIEMLKYISSYLLNSHNGLVDMNGDLFETPQEGKY